MKPDDIKPGRTYEGAEGERRTVVYITGPRAMPPSHVWWDNGTAQNPRGVTSIASFAAWAVREVEADRARVLDPCLRRTQALIVKNGPKL